MNEAKFDRSSDENAAFVVLAGKDLEDAKRLLTLLSEGPAIVPPDDSRPAESNKRSTDELMAQAGRLLANRRKRAQRFGRAMFGEPAWDMLLLLYACQAGTRYTASRLAQFSGLSKATAYRWIEYLEREQLIRRDPHPTDTRSTFVGLTDKGKSSLELYLSDTLA